VSPSNTRAQDFNRKTIAFIKSIKSEISPEKQIELEKALGWTENEFSKFLEGNRELNAVQLSKVSTLFNFSLNAFGDDRGDDECLFSIDL
jgi:hypothetical protein